MGTMTGVVVAVEVAVDEALVVVGAVMPEEMPPCAQEEESDAMAALVLGPTAPYPVVAGVPAETMPSAL